MFAVDTNGDARGPGRQGHFERSQIARMNDSRLELPQQSIQPRKELDAVPWRLVQGDELDVRPGHARAERRIAV